ncbi:hypothetical protein F0562_027352 [Nyssa sinensis]|uniref:DUF4219 domain-containing protein n=1 Tax=Nyssa sinensis TaxID=561372 RepID=A0A5J5B631_9ASTE|nr:hypothetical protein F0562_027352 [Nyssa sinensis]
MAALNGSIQPNLPKFDGNKFGRWCIQMKVLFGYQKILEIVENGFADPGENATIAQREALRENKKKDQKGEEVEHDSRQSSILIDLEDEAITSQSVLANEESQSAPAYEVSTSLVPLNVGRPKRNL